MIVIRVDTTLCKGCNFCIYICPQEVLETAKEPSSKGYLTATPQHPENCILCQACEQVCPDFAISVKELDED